MSVRFNVSLPDDLAERVEPYRDSINLSALLADAVEKEIDRMEALEIKPKTKKSRIAELNAQRRVAGQADREQGFADGAAWANEDATYEQAEALYQAVHAALSEPRSIAGIADCLAAKLLEDWFDEWDDELKPTHEDLYWEGFAEGVHKAWGSLREELEG
ncbi:MAG: hypothetical protein ACYTDU_05450 [Planctomycetota bacterium]|jgi:post-segregation antitoxin (ccd killing protein)